MTLCLTLGCSSNEITLRFSTILLHFLKFFLCKTGIITCRTYTYRDFIVFITEPKISALDFMFSVHLKLHLYFVLETYMSLFYNPFFLCTCTHFRMNAFMLKIEKHAFILLLFIYIIIYRTYNGFAHNVRYFIVTGLCHFWQKHNSWDLRE